ncbi:MAG TPA: cytochrome c3 family protein [Kofleriaceae bacterium]|nr:cytochrome c3 family protein [Kofleriaceae bacterium]
MAALYGPGANRVYRGALLVLAATAAAVVAAPMFFVRSPYAAGVGDPVEQPIAFDHRHHVRDDGIDCLYCHDTADTGAGAGMPATARCMGCHGQVRPDSPVLEPLREAWRTGEPIRWRRINSVPSYVYFHHGVHVHAGIACARCHGAVEDMARVVRVHGMTMDFCVDCHREAQGSRAITHLTTCSACHR